MKQYMPEISWHSRDAIYSVDFLKVGANIGGSRYKIATAGIEKIIRIWELDTRKIKDRNCPVEFLSSLSLHNDPVNVIRFSPKDECLASGDVQGLIVLWERSDSDAPDIFGNKDDDEPNKETWNVRKKLRGHIDDICDLSWSSDAKLLVSVSMDKCMRVWNVDKGESLKQINFHHFLNGVAFDPRGDFVAVMSTDRSLYFHSTATTTNSSWRRLKKMTKAKLPCYEDKQKEKAKQENLPPPPTDDIEIIDAEKQIKDKEKEKEFRLFHDDQLMAFVRRPQYSPNGEILVVPSGYLELGNKNVNVSYLFTRKKMDRPCLVLPCPEKPTISVQFCPKLFELYPGMKNFIDLPYRAVYAIISQESVCFYHTQQLVPFAYIGNIHYAPLTDISWSDDGLTVVVASIDGYCSVITFEEGELGVPLKEVPALPAPPPPPPKPAKTPKVPKEPKTPKVPKEPKTPKLPKEHTTPKIPTEGKTHKTPKRPKHVAADSAEASDSGSSTGGPNSENKLKKSETKTPKTSVEKSSKTGKKRDDASSTPASKGRLLEFFKKAQVEKSLATPDEGEIEIVGEILSPPLKQLSQSTVVKTLESGIQKPPNKDKDVPKETPVVVASSSALPPLSALSPAAQLGKKAPKRAMLIAVKPSAVTDNVTNVNDNAKTKPTSEKVEKIDSEDDVSEKSAPLNQNQDSMSSITSSVSTPPKPPKRALLIPLK